MKWDSIWTHDGHVRAGLVLFVFVVLSQERHRVVHFGVTEHPTQQWTMRQLREAFPWEEAPHYVLRDRDAIYGRDFAAVIGDMGMEEVLTAPRSPRQNPFVERLVGTFVIHNKSAFCGDPRYVAFKSRKQCQLAHCLNERHITDRGSEVPEEGHVSLVFGPVLPGFCWFGFAVGDSFCFLLLAGVGC